MTSLGNAPVIQPWPQATLAWASDLFLLVGLLGFITFFLFWGRDDVAFLSTLQGQTQSVSLNVQDANALSQGSPVRFLGVPVGQVDKVWADDEGAHVRVRLRKSAPPIPLGATANVMSFGLAGNRSLEFEPPATDDAKATLLAGLTPSRLTAKPNHEREQSFSPYEVDKPIRIEESMKVQLQVAQLLKTGADNMNEGLFQTPIPQLQHHIHQNSLAVEQAVQRQKQFVQTLQGRKQAYQATVSHMMALVALFENSAKNLSGSLKASEALDKASLQNHLQTLRQSLTRLEQAPFMLQVQTTSSPPYFPSLPEAKTEETP